MKFYVALKSVLIMVFYGGMIGQVCAENLTKFGQSSTVKITKTETETHKSDSILKKTPKKTQPTIAATIPEGVHPVSEKEVYQALKDPRFKVVDMRTNEWRSLASIKGSIHIPYNQIHKRLNELGCQGTSEKWNCSKSLKVVIFCNGTTCAQSPKAIKVIIKAGFPVNHIYYYRGNIQSWILYWLTNAE